MTQSQPQLQVIYASAPWCRPCKALRPAFDKAMAEHAPGVAVQSLDIEQSQTEAYNRNIMGVPTVIVQRGGVEIARQVGAVSPATMGQFIARHFGA